MHSLFTFMLNFRTQKELSNLKESSFQQLSWGDPKNETIGASLAKYTEGNKSFSLTATTLWQHAVHQHKGDWKRKNIFGSLNTWPWKDRCMLRIHGASECIQIQGCQVLRFQIPPRVTLQCWVPCFASFWLVTVEQGGLDTSSYARRSLAELFISLDAQWLLNTGSFENACSICIETSPGHHTEPIDRVIAALYYFKIGLLIQFKIYRDSKFWRIAALLLTIHSCCFSLQLSEHLGGIWWFFGQSVSRVFPLFSISTSFLIGLDSEWRRSSISVKFLQVFNLFCYAIKRELHTIRSCQEYLPLNLSSSLSPFHPLSHHFILSLPPLSSSLPFSLSQSYHLTLIPFSPSPPPLSPALPLSLYPSPSPSIYLRTSIPPSLSGQIIALHLLWWKHSSKIILQS